MIDREKVIKGLECCTNQNVNCKAECPYYGAKPCPEMDCFDVVKKDALALLKAQEPKPVHVTAIISNRKIGECPNCGKPINSGDYPRYCGDCGQAVKWE